MANRFGQQFSYTLQKQVWSIYAKVTFGSSGAPTLVQGNPAASPGVVSVTRNAAGQFTFVFGTKTGMLDVWPRFLCADVVYNSGSSAPAAPGFAIITDSSATAASCSMKVRLTNTSGADTDPASGEIGYFKFIFSNSNAP